MSSHTRMTPITKDQRIRAMWSRAPTGKAIVFVHGYAGNTVDTWKRFDDFLTFDPKAAGYDLFFYGYDGIRGTIYPLSQALSNFLTELHANPGSLTKTAPVVSKRPASYAKVLVVAHS